MRVGLLHPVQQCFHLPAQVGHDPVHPALAGQRRTGRNCDRNLVAAQSFRMVLGPDPVYTPDDERNDRHRGVQRHPGRTGLEILQLETAADGGLRIHPDQFTGAQPVQRHRVGVATGAAVHRDGAGVGDQEVDPPHVLHLGLDHEPHPAAPGRGGQGRGQKVHIAGVVDRDDRPA